MKDLVHPVEIKFRLRYFLLIADCREMKLCCDKRLEPRVEDQMVQKNLLSCKIARHYKTHDYFDVLHIGQGSAEMMLLYHLLLWGWSDCRASLTVYISHVGADDLLPM